MILRGNSGDFYKVGKFSAGNFIKHGLINFSIYDSKNWFIIQVTRYQVIDSRISSSSD